MLNLKTLSNISFIIPLVLAVSLKIYFMIFFIGLAMVVSLVYHVYDERRLQKIDMIAAFMLIGANLFLCYQFGFAFPYFHLALLFVAFAVYFYLKQNKNNYNLNHSLWHLSSVLITISCILGYAAK